MLPRNFNLIEGSLYRTPLSLIEAMKGDIKRSWDLGYHHAKRGQRFNWDGAADKESYKQGYISGKQEGRVVRSTGRTRKQQMSYDAGFEAGKGGRKPAPGGVPNPDHYSDGYDAGEALRKEKEAQQPQRSRVQLRPRPPLQTAAPSAPRAKSGGLRMFHDPPHPVGKMGGVYPEPYSQEAKFLKHPDWESAFHKAAESAVSGLNARGYQIGERLGGGAHGMVYRGPQLQDGSPSAYKIELGDDEARLARHYLSTPELAKVGTLPKYFSVQRTGASHSITGEPLMLIHREDLSDVGDHPAAGPAMSLLYLVSRVGRKIQDAVSGEDDDFLGKTREDVISHLSDQIDGLQSSAEANLKDPKALAHYNQLADGLKSMSRMGIIPCDTSLHNMGVRPSTGELVIRDPGCYGLV